MCGGERRRGSVAAPWAAAPSGRALEGAFACCRSRAREGGGAPPPQLLPACLPAGSSSKPLLRPPLPSQAPPTLPRRRALWALPPPPWPAFSSTTQQRKRRRGSECVDGRQPRSRQQCRPGPTPRVRCSADVSASALAIPHVQRDWLCAKGQLPVCWGVPLRRQSAAACAGRCSTPCGHPCSGTHPPPLPPS